MARPRALVLTALVALLCVSACAGDGGGAADGATPTIDTSPTSPTETTQTGPPTTPTTPATTPASTPETRTRTTQAPDPLADGIVYMPWGPDDPPIPTQYAALAASPGSPPDCDRLAANQPGSAFWDLALQVCRAIIEGQPWPQTRTVPQPPSANEYQACLDAELTAMLEQALQFHAKYPDQAPKVNFQSGTTTSPCQRRLYGVRVVDESSRTAEPGTVPVAIGLPALNEEPTVKVDGETTDVVDTQENDGLATIVVLVPLTSEPRTAEILVETHRGTLREELPLPAGAATTTGTQEPTEPTITDAPATEPTDRATERATEPATEPTSTATSTQ